MNHTRLLLLTTLVLTTPALAQSAPTPASTPAVTQAQPFRTSDVMKLDHLLLLTAKRMHVALLVAQAKYPTGAIEDLKREAVVIETTGQSAGQYGVRAGLARDFMAGQIEASKRAQRAFFASWKAAGRGRFSKAPDLARDVRPVLDDLTPKIMRALADVQPLLDRPGAAALIRERARHLSSSLPEYGPPWEAAVKALLQHAAPAESPAQGRSSQAPVGR